jgi:hypothetical protein
VAGTEQAAIMMSWAYRLDGDPLAGLRAEAEAIAMANDRVYDAMTAWRRQQPTAGIPSGRMTTRREADPAWVAAKERDREVALDMARDAIGGPWEAVR